MQMKKTPSFYAKNKRTMMVPLSLHIMQDIMHNHSGDCLRQSRFPATPERFLIDDKLPLRPVRVQLSRVPSCCGPFT